MHPSQEPVRGLEPQAGHKVFFFICCMSTSILWLQNSHSLYAKENKGLLMVPVRPVQVEISSKLFTIFFSEVPGDKC